MNQGYDNSEMERSASHPEIVKAIKTPAAVALGNLITWQTLIGMLGLFAALILFATIGFVPSFNAICDANISFNQMIQGQFAEALQGNEWCLIYHRKTFLFLFSMIAAFGAGFGALIAAAYRRVWGSLALAFLLAYLWFGLTSIFGAGSESNAPAISTISLLLTAILGCIAAAIGYNLRRLVMGFARTPRINSRDSIESEEQP